MMIRQHAVAAALLLSATMVSSCTCHQEVPPSPPTFAERPQGFHAAQPSATVPAVATATPVAQTPTPPGADAPEATPTLPSQIPANFPKDVPIYKGADLQQVQDLANDAHNVVFSVAASVKDVSGFYADRLLGAGWKMTQQFERSNHAFMSFKKGDLIANVTIADDVNNPGKQFIAIMYEEEQPLPFEEF